MAIPNTNPTPTLRLNWSALNRLSGRRAMKANTEPASRKRMAMNNNGGISNTASFENIQLMAAIKVTTTNKRSDLRAFERGIHNRLAEGRLSPAYGRTAAEFIMGGLKWLFREPVRSFRAGEPLMGRISC